MALSSGTLRSVSIVSQCSTPSASFLSALLRLCLPLSLSLAHPPMSITGSLSHVYHWLILPCLSLAHYLPPSPWFTPFATISNISISFQHPQTLCSQESFGILIETFCMREFCANRVSVVDGRTDTSELSFTVTSISQRMK